MPEFLGPEKRGRKREALRLRAATLAAQVKPATGEQTYSVEVSPAIPAQRKTKDHAAVKATAAQTVSRAIPKSAVVVPFALTNGKSKDTVRETLAHGAKDAGIDVSIGFDGWTLDDGSTVVRVFYLDVPKVKTEK